MSRWLTVWCAVMWQLKEGSNEARTSRMLAMLQPYVPEEDLSDTADFLAGLLQYHPTHRTTVQQALQHSWVNA